jgi:hypothetical protein
MRRAPAAGLGCAACDPCACSSRCSPVPALLACAGSAQAATSASQRAPACAAKGSVTVAANPLARVYVRARRGDADQHVLVGCLLHSGQRVELDSWSSCGCSRGDESAPQVWLRQRIVAVNRYSCPPDPTLGDCVGEARTVSLRTGETLRRAISGTSVAALVLGPRGSFAYVSAAGAVVKSDATGETVVLDAGPGIDPGSLAVAGARVYWLRGGAAQTALLAP